MENCALPGLECDRPRVGAGAPHLKDSAAVVAKWIGDAHPDFDAIYEWLLRLAEEYARSER